MSYDDVIAQVMPLQQSDHHWVRDGAPSQESLSNCCLGIRSTVSLEKPMVYVMSNAQDVCLIF